jgi:hypothetical protein
MLPQVNAVHETIFEAKQIICPLGLEVEKSTRARMIAFYIMGTSMKTLKNVLFVDSTNSIVQNTTVMMRTATEIEENAGIKKSFGTFLSFLI